jgi:F-type H+-transporting ATPase subunit b
MLDLDWTTILFEMLNFVVLAWLLNRFVFQPVLVKVRLRAAEKEQLMLEAEEARTAAKKDQAEWHGRLASIEEESQRLLAEAVDTAQQEHKSIVQDAHDEASKILHLSQLEMMQRETAAVQQHQADLLETILSVSRQVIQNGAPPSVHNDLVEQVNSKIWDLGGSDIERVNAIRASVTQTDPIVNIQSAFPLTPEQMQLMAQTFAALMDRNVQIEQEEHPDLGAGLRVRIGDLMIENSLADQLDNLRDKVSEMLATQFGVEQNERIRV